MKNILISIKPQYVCKILNEEKILEIRKSIPKCELPCKVYIYCTKGNEELRLFNQKVCASLKIARTKTYSIAQQKAYTKFIEDESQSLNGKVVAEFTLNKYAIIERDLNDWLPKNRYETTKEQLKDSCLTEEELWEYGQGKQLYAWYIDNLIIYGKPKELKFFSKFGYEPLGYSSICGNRGCPFFADSNCYDLPPDCLLDKDCVITKPPQSWCYVA